MKIQNIYKSVGLTGNSELLFERVSSTPVGPTFAVGVTGKECADVVE